MTGVAPASPSPPDDAGQWRHLHPLTPWFRGGVVIVVLVGMVVNNARDNLVEAIEFIRTGGAIWVVVGIAALAVAVTGYSFLWWRLARYRIGADTVELRSGILFRQQRSFRLDQLEAVDVVHPLVARLLGLAKLTLESAGGADSKLQLHYLTRSDAEAIRSDLLRRRNAPAGLPYPAVPPEQRTVPLGQRTDPPEQRTGQAVCLTDQAEHGTVPPEHRTHPAEHGTVPPEHGTVPPEHRTDRPEHRTDRAEHGTVPPEHGTVPPLCRTDSAQVPDVPLFQIPPAWTLGAYFRSLTPYVLCLSALAAIGGSVGAVVLGRPEALSGLLGALPFLFAVFSHLKRYLLEEMMFSGFARPDGLRLRHGLTTTTNQTIPAHRIQAVQLTQRWLWRKKDWWRVEINVAGYGLASAKETRTVLVPVADPGLAALAIGAVMPEATAPDTWPLIERALHWPIRPDGIVGPPRRARRLDPMTWDRDGFASSPFALVIRTGRLQRRVVVAPHDRTQGFIVRQGPWQRGRGVATVDVCSLPGPVAPSLSHLDSADAARALAVQAPLSWFGQRRAARVAPVLPVLPVAPVAPVLPAAPVCPGTPYAPVPPAAPATPYAPVAPADPAASFAPALPTVPVTPPQANPAGFATSPVPSAPPGAPPAVGPMTPAPPAQPDPFAPPRPRP